MKLVLNHIFRPLLISNIIQFYRAIVNKDILSITKTQINGFCFLYSNYFTHSFGKNGKIEKIRRFLKAVEV